MASPLPPPPGVSGISEDGVRVGTEKPGRMAMVPNTARDQAPKAPRAGKAAPAAAPGPRAQQKKPQRDPSDVLANKDSLRRVDAGTPPAGSNRVPVDIREAPGVMQTRGTRSFTSVDGQTYTFRTVDDRGNPLPVRFHLVHFLSLREMHLGGDPNTVFKAFAVNISDVNGKPVIPYQTDVPSDDIEITGDGEFALGEEG